MQTLNQYIKEKLSLSTAREYTKASEGKYKTYLNDVFNGEYRIYIPLEMKTDEIENSPLMNKVLDHILDKGVKIDEVDYINGKIMSNKNILNIGRLIKDDPNLLIQFNNDPLRIKDNTCEIVISRHPYDIAGMSTDRGWKSCMEIGTGAQYSFIKNDIKYGTLVAYLISKNDRNINRPLSRILIKPYIRAQNDKVAYGMGPIYGIDIPFFYNTLQRWVDRNLNININGIYSKHPELYTDIDQAEELIIGDTNIQDYIKGSYVDEKGYTVITHSLRFTKARLKALKTNTLPFKNMKVIVQGDFSCEDCGLSTLEGAPIAVYGEFNASNNNLTSLKYCPQGAQHYFFMNNMELTSLVGAPQHEIKGDFNVYRCGLSSLKGAPRKVNGAFNCSANPLISLEGSPDDVYIFNCSSCNLDSLKGAPKTVKGDFICNNNYLKDLRFAPEEVEHSFICQNVPLVSLQGIPKYIGMNFSLTTNIDGHRFTENEIRRLSNIQGYVESERLF